MTKSCIRQRERESIKEIDVENEKGRKKRRVEERIILVVFRAK